MDGEGGMEGEGGRREGSREGWIGEEGMEGEEGRRRGREEGRVEGEGGMEEIKLSG